MFHGLLCAVAGVVPAVQGARVEEVSWASGRSAFTAPFEELTAYLAQVTDRTTVSRVLRISWQAVGSIVERVVSRQMDESRFDDVAARMGTHQPDRRISAAGYRSALNVTTPPM